MTDSSATTGHDVVMYEDSGGGLHIEAANRVYSGYEQLGVGEGLGCMLTAAMGLPDGLDAAPVSAFMQDGEFQAPGQVIAVYDPTTHPQSAQIVIYPLRCSKAGRRILGLPVVGVE